MLLTPPKRPGQPLFGDQPQPPQWRHYPSGEAYTYSPNDLSVGDLDGDGEYEIVVKWDPSNAKDNSQSGYTGNVIVDAYVKKQKADGVCHRLFLCKAARDLIGK